jgi:hypothetical protein
MDERHHVEYGSLEWLRVQEEALIKQGYTRAPSSSPRGPKQYSLEPERESDMQGIYVLKWESD